MGSVRRDDFDFPLPRELIAERPCEPRDAARLLVIPAAGGLERVSIGRHRYEQPPSPFPLPPRAGLSGENWTVVRAERFAANFGSESPLPGLVPGTHVSSQPGSPRQRRGLPDQVRPRGLSLVAQDRSFATDFDSPDSPAPLGAERVG